MDDHEFCGNCKFFAKDSGPIVDMGECRRRSPRISRESSGGVAEFPMVFTYEFCGEFKMSLKPPSPSPPSSSRTQPNPPHPDSSSHS